MDRIAELEGRLATAEAELANAKAELVKAGEERDFFRDTLNALRTMVSALRPDGTIVWANEILLNLSQAPLEKIVGQSAYNRPEIPEADAILTKQLIERVGQGESMGSREFTIKDIEGRTLWIFLIMTPITRNGKVVYIVNNSFDITDRKIAEEKLRIAKEDLEKANKLKDQFVALVSHDLRSPLGNIMGMLEILSGKIKGAVKDSDLFYLSRAQANCHSLINMVDRLLDVNRLRTGKVRVTKAFFGAKRMVEDRIGRVAALAAEKNIRMDVDIPLAARLFADESLIGEVVQNIAGNAVKFLRNGDSLTITSPVPGVLEFRDTGPGIAPHLLPNLFNHDTRTTTPGTKGEKGMGMGLPLCHDIMKAHGGSIAVESSAAGAVFRMTLPEAKALALVVDDLEPAREEIVDQLSAMGVEAIEAANGREALDRLAEAEPHLVITDIMMPEMDGFELLKIMRKSVAYEKIPVIVITSSGDMTAREKAFELGADDFVTKPLAPDDFIPRVKRFVKA